MRTSIREDSFFPQVIWIYIILNVRGADAFLFWSFNFVFLAVRLNIPAVTPRYSSSSGTFGVTATTLLLYCICLRGNKVEIDARPHNDLLLSREGTVLVQTFRSSCLSTELEKYSDTSETNVTITSFLAYVLNCIRWFRFFFSSFSVIIRCVDTLSVIDSRLFSSPPHRNPIRICPPVMLFILFLM